MPIQTSQTSPSAPLSCEYPIFEVMHLLSSVTNVDFVGQSILILGFDFFFILCIFNSFRLKLISCCYDRSLAAAERTVKCMQSDHKRLSAQRAALFPKLQFCQQDVQEEDCQGDAGMSSDGNEEGDTDLHDSSSPTTLATNGSQISLTEVDSNSRLVYIMQIFVQNLSQTWRMLE